MQYFNYCILAWGATINEGNPLHLAFTKESFEINIQLKLHCAH